METSTTTKKNIHRSVKESALQNFSIVGRQGCSGSKPGNTLPAFMEAVKAGVTAIELDVMMTHDGELVVTDLMTTDPARLYHPLKREEELVWNLNLQELQEYDCGRRFQAEFPFRQYVSSAIPTLKEVFSRIEKYILWNNSAPVKYFIDIPTSPDTDNLFHPKPEEFILKLTDLIRRINIARRVTVVSADIRPLQIMKRLNQHVSIALKVENDESATDNIEALGFLPDYYLTHCNLINRELVSYLHAQSVKLLSWGANDLLDMNEMFCMEADGIITDYPFIAQKLIARD